MKLLKKSQLLICIISLSTCGYTTLPWWQTATVGQFIKDRFEGLPDHQYIKPSQMAIMYESRDPNIGDAIANITKKYKVPERNQIACFFDKGYSKESSAIEATKIKQMSDKTRILFIITVNSDLGEMIKWDVFNLFNIPIKNVTTNPASIFKYPIQIIELSKLDRKRPFAKCRFYQPDSM